MFTQELINVVENWTYRNEVKAFDQEYKELAKGRQFPYTEESSKKLESILTYNYKDNKISIIQRTR